MYIIFYLIWYLFVFLFGDVVFSFLSTVIYKYCKSLKSKRYPVIELIGGGCALLCSWKFIDPGYFTLTTVLSALLCFYMCAVLTVIAFIDWETQIIHDASNLALLLGGVFAAFVFEDITVIERLIGLVCISLPMFVLTRIKKETFGGGDVKLFAALGVFFGWQQTILLFVLSVIIAGVYAAMCISKKIKDIKDTFSFGPFVCISALIVMMLGEYILA